MTAKFVDALPFHRQKKLFARMGIKIEKKELKPDEHESTWVEPDYPMPLDL